MMKILKVLALVVGLYDCVGLYACDWRHLEHIRSEIVKGLLSEPIELEFPAGHAVYLSNLTDLLAQLKIEKSIYVSVPEMTLSMPRNDVTVKLTTSHFQAQGSRPKMEDEHDIVIDQANNRAFFGVYDGHGGKAVATYLKDNLIKNLQVEIEKKDGRSPEEILKTVFAQTDSQLKDQAWAQGCGSTVALAWIEGDMLHLAHVADTRALLFDVQGRVMYITKDHVLDPDEIARIRYAGGFVTWGGRVSGTLAIPRAFGDFMHLGRDGEKLILSMPTITSIKLTGKESYLVVACDGLWEVMDDNLGQDGSCPEWQTSEVAQFIFEQERTGVTQSELAQALVAEALQRGSRDNISAIVVKFGWQE